MNSEERNQEFFKIKEEQGLKEYIFFTPAGYRHFFVLGKDLKDAEKNFERIDERKRCGFRLEDLPIRLEFDKEKCKDWSWDDFADHNENKESVLNSDNH